MLQLFLSALFGLLAGLLGTTVQAHFQRREKAAERVERRHEIRREKSERVFEELRLLVDAYNNQAIYALQLIGPAPGKPEAPPSPSAAMLSGLIAIYFHDRAPLVDAFHAEMKALYAAYSDELGKAVKEGGGADAIRGIHVLMTQDAAKRAINFSERLTAEMREEIDKLWQ